MADSQSKQILELSRILETLNPTELRELQDEVLKSLDHPIWTPLPGPQMDAMRSEADIVFFGGSAGGSKMLALDTQVPTPEGWTTIGEIQDGDVIFSELGKPIQVLKTHPIDPSPVSYRLKFDDGTEIDACADHRWVTWTKSDRRYYRERLKQRDTFPNNWGLFKTESGRILGKIKTTLEIYKSKHLRHCIPCAKPLVFKEVKLPIHPYVLGYLLGDGDTIGEGRVACNPNERDEIITIFQKYGYPCTLPSDNGHFFVKGIGKVWRKYGLYLGKYIPKEYLRASIEQRRLLLAGLFDSDGSCVERKCSFTNTNYKLCESVLELLVSLGMRARIQRGNRRGKSKSRNEADSWQVCTSSPIFDIFATPRNLNKLRKINLSHKGINRARYIVDCQPIEPIPMRCLTVDNPTGLYLASRSMVPTHNTDLLLGLALTQQKRSIIYRREATQTVALVDRLSEILGTRDGWNGQQLIWRMPNRQIEFGSCANPGDEQKWAGRPHDFIGYDELTQLTEFQFRFLQTWNRTTDPHQRCRVVCTSNPPTDEDGRWVISYWGPWLDPKHPHPAKPGELRWYTTIDGKDVEVPSGDPIRVNGVLVKPLSRTFIPSRVQDNPFLMGTNYEAILQALPEPLRSQMLEGNFQAGIKDSEWQVIPTSWVEEAQDRWSEDGKKGMMDSMGVDVARGGIDRTVISTRFGPWYAPLICYPGRETPDGGTAAGLVIAALRDAAPIHVDIIGVGGSLYDHLRSNKIHVIAVNGSSAPPEGSTDRATQKMRFRNMRSYIWWRFRESLDPKTGNKVALPPDPELKADLCAPLWMLTPSGIQIESKEDKFGDAGVKIAGLKRRLGRSPDKGEAVVYCSMATIRLVRLDEMPPAQRLAHSYAVNIDPNQRYKGNIR